ncbi:hypothetical protein [Acidipropionibacterium jensenii]|uniref:hypothetical protein n=1 Tax=Acidipropionibacterium jensenii TaxID=1749 RepID=UPI00214B69FE|nr:hypothetical protein [Acidipropionibacterium jensenii]
MMTLDWVAKPFGAGDIAGDGTKKLLGTSVATPSLLLRETAQNSWDARADGVIPEYQMRFRTLSQDALEVLRDSVFATANPASELASALAGETIEAIEIHDRGTSGLGGPTNNDARVGEDASTNYRDFVLTVGAPRGRSLGGGTYGFGKSAAFRASSCGTLVIWTRIQTSPGQFEERFIAAAVTPSFQMDDKRYTGQQWWGLRSDEGQPSAVQPVLGEDAHALGSAVFERGFDDDQTGTSLLLLAPVFDDGRQSFIDEARTAVPVNLWAKRVAGQAEHRTMLISVVVDGEPVHIPGAADSRVLAAKQACLEAVRATQAADDAPEPASSQAAALVSVEEIWCRNPKKLVGHLGLTPCAVPPGDPFKNAENRVTLMRNSAELVVEDREYPNYRNLIGEWVGVFKPVPEMDADFSAAEPPTHDSWNPSALEPAQKRLVNTGLRRIGEEVRGFLAPADDIEAEQPAEAASKLASALGVLAKPLAASRPSGRRPTAKKSSDVRTRTSKVEVLGYQLVPPSPHGDPTAAVTRFTLHARSDGEYVQVTPKLDIGIDGRASLGDPDEIYISAWQTSEGTKYDYDGIRVRSGETFTADVSYPAGVAIDCSFLGEDA